MAIPQPPEQTPDLLDSPAAGGTAIRGTAVRSAGLVVTMLLGLVSAPLVTRHLGAEDFGRYLTVFSLVTLVALLTEGGLGALAVRELAVLDPERRRELMRNLVGMRAVLMLAGIAFAVAFSALAGYGGELVLGTVVASAGVFAYGAQGVASVPLAAELRLGWVTAAEVVRQVVFVAALAACVLAGTGVVPLLGATIPAGIAGTAVLAWALRGRGIWRPAFEWATWRAILRDAIPVGLAGAIYSACFRVVILMMSVIAVAVQTGYFALSFRVVEVLVAVPALLTGSMLPIFSRAAHTDEPRLAFAFGRTYDMAVVCGVGLTLVTFTGAPLAMSVLTGDASGPPVGVLEIQSFTLIAVSINAAYGAVLIALRRHRDLVAISLVTLVITVIAAAILVPAADARGGAYAALIGEWSLTALAMLALWRVRPRVHPGQLAVVKALAAAAIAAAVASLLDVPSFPNLAPPVVAGLVYAVALATLRGIPRELVDALLSRGGARSAPTSRA